MKRIICAMLCAIMLLVLTGCRKTIFFPTGSQPNSFFFEDTRRFIPVDSGKEFGNYACAVYADKVTDNMYLLIKGSYSISACPLFNEDGSLMKYDE